MSVTRQTEITIHILYEDVINHTVSVRTLLA
jgi:hypothetical protein